MHAMYLFKVHNISVLQNMQESKLTTIFKIIECVIYFTLVFGAVIFVKGNWDEYQAQATSIIFSSKAVESIPSATFVICFDPIAKLSVMSQYNATPEDFVTNDVLEDAEEKDFSKSWNEIFHESSFRLGRDFTLDIDLLDQEHEIMLDTKLLSSEEELLVEVEEMYTLWSGLCTKIKPKIDHSETAANMMKIRLTDSIIDSDLPKIKIYFTSKDNAGI